MPTSDAPEWGESPRTQSGQSMQSPMNTAVARREAGGEVALFLLPGRWVERGQWHGAAPIVALQQGTIPPHNARHGAVANFH